MQRGRRCDCGIQQRQDGEVEKEGCVGTGLSSASACICAVLAPMPSHRFATHKETPDPHVVPPMPLSQTPEEKVAARKEAAEGSIKAKLENVAKMLAKAGGVFIAGPKVGVLPGSSGARLESE